MKLDNIHWQRHRLLSYKKEFNIAISPREPGKSTQLWDLVLSTWRKGGVCIIIRRLTADITDQYISDSQKIYDKFKEPITLSKKGEANKGVVDIMAKEGDGEARLFCRIFSLSAPLQRLKSLVLLNAKWILFDEFIVNTALGEKYLLNEVFRFKEIYNTFQRECKGKLRAIFFGNPYSLFNPYFIWLKVPIKEIYPGRLLTGPNWAMEVIELTEELKKYILDHNPLYQFDDSYRKYAFDGRAINDANIRIVEHAPNCFQLKFLFRYENKLLGAFAWTPDNVDLNLINQHFNDNDAIDYWIGNLPDDYTSTRRPVAAFNVNDMVDGTYLVGPQERKLFDGLQDAFRFRRIGFQSVGESYALQTIINI